MPNPMDVMRRYFEMEDGPEKDRLGRSIERQVNFCACLVILAPVVFILMVVFL